MKKQTQLVLAGLVSALVVAGCATGPSVAELNALTDQIVKASFRDQGIAKVDRLLATDETNRLCSEADVAGKPLDEKTAKRIEEVNLKAIKWPSDGKFLGDWKEGEKIAQSGRGLTWTDDAKTVNGGNCYNCHQIDKKEISFGTIGPSLYNYGKIRTGSTLPALRATMTPSPPSSTTALKAAWVWADSRLSVGCRVRGRREVAMKLPAKRSTRADSQ